MKKKDIVRCAVAALVATSVGFAGCVDTEKDFSKEPSTEAGIPNDFNFSTKKAVEFTLKYDVPMGYRVHFEMYSKSPLTLDAYKSYVKDQTLIPFFSGRADKNGIVTCKGELPASVSEIYAYCSGFGMPVLMKASVSDAGVVSDFKETEIPSASSTRSANGESGTTSWKSYDVTIAKPALEAVSREISQEDKNLIEKSFSVDQGLEAFLTYRQTGIELHKDATVKIYSVSNGGTSDRTNALAYYTYNSAQHNDLVPQDISSELKLIFPTLNKTTPAEGAGYQLLYNSSKEFKAGTSIGFALFPNVGSGEIATNPAEVLFSHYKISDWNTYTFPTTDVQGSLIRLSVPHMVLSLLKIDDDGHAIIAIGFEDQPYDATLGTNRADFRDDIFILEVDPRSSLPEDLPTPPVEEPEYDMEFAYPGILCFEDSWPENGDYDMNDITIAYNRLVYFREGHGSVAMKETYTFLNNGANYTNGFGYQLTGLKKAEVIKCQVESDYECVGQGLDGDLDDPTIMLFDNGQKIKAGTTFTVYTSFNNPSYFGTVNPFIVVNTPKSLGDFLSEGRTEVHLPTTKQHEIYLPTKKANTTLWGTSDDKSAPDQNIYYVRAGNYPFAFDIRWDSSKHGSPTKFVVPEEKLSIEKTYPKFVNWVESNGKKDVDWFLYPQD